MSWEVRQNEAVPDFQPWLEAGGIEILIERMISMYIYSEIRRMGRVERVSHIRGGYHDCRRATNWGMQVKIVV
jgi:hypothetical protein